MPAAVLPKEGGHNALPELVQNIDLVAVVNRLLALVDTSDPCFLLVVLGMVTFLGSRMASAYPKLLTWGARLGLAAFLGNIGYVYFTQGGIDNGQWPQVIIRSLVAAGLVVAPMWTVLPVLTFVYKRIRLTVASYLLYFGYACLTAPQLDHETLQIIALRAVLTTGLVLVVAWILQPVTDFLGQHLFPKKTSQPAPANCPASPALGEALASPRQETRLLREAARQVDAQRRSRARLRAELCYTMYETALGERFPRYVFEDFLSRYLGEHLRVEDVEEHLRELEAIIQQHAGTAAHSPLVVQPLDLTDLTRWLLEEQERIKTAEMDQGQRRTQLSGITRRYTELATKMIEDES